MSEWLSNYVKDSEDYSYDLVNSGGRRDVEPNWAERLMGYTLYHGYWDLLGGKSHRYWQNFNKTPSAITRTDGGKDSQKMPNRRNDGKKPAWYGPGKNQFKYWTKGKVTPWGRLTSAQKNNAYIFRSGYGKRGFSKVGSQNPRQRARGAMTVRGRGGRSGTVRTYRAPTNYAVQQRGGGNYASRPIRTMGGSGRVMRYKAFVGTLVFKTGTGFTDLTINAFNCGGQVYFNPSIAQYFGSTPFQIQARLYEHFKWVSLCLELSTRLPTTDTTGVVWGASDDPLYFKKVGVANSTVNVTKATLLAMSRSGTFNAWTPRVCVPLPIDRRWKFTAGPDVGAGAFDFGDSSSAQRDSYGGCVGITLEGTTPGADLQVANVWFDQKILVRRIGTGATTQVNAHEIKVPLDKKEKYDKAMALVEDDNFDVDRCLADLKLVDDTVRVGEEDDEKDNWRWLKKYGTSIKDRSERPPTPTLSVKSDKSVKPKSNSLK